MVQLSLSVGRAVSIFMNHAKAHFLSNYCSAQDKVKEYFKYQAEHSLSEILSFKASEPKVENTTL